MLVFLLVIENILYFVHLFCCFRPRARSFTHYSYYCSHIIKLLITWLAPWAGKMSQIARCDWLPERARWSHLARSGLPAVSRKQNFTKSHIINPLLTNFVRSRWLNIEHGQYLAILTSHLVNNPYILPARAANHRAELIWLILPARKASHVIRETIALVRVRGKVYNTIHWINHYPADSVFLNHW